MIALHRKRPGDCARFLVDDMIEDVEERLSFLRHAAKKALVVGDWTGDLTATFTARGIDVHSEDPSEGFDEEAPYPDGNFDLVVSLGTLDTINDLPGALIHIRNALSPGGLMIASFIGAGSLPELRAALLVADEHRPAPRLHPAVDVRAGGQLLQRTGFSDPVIDARNFTAAYRSLDRLVLDLRQQGLSNVLADSGPPLGKAARDRARAAFAAAAESGRTIETFEILTLSGWRR